MLQQMGEYLPKPRYEMAESQENRKKNRHPDALPGISRSHRMIELVSCCFQNNIGYRMC